MIEDHEIDVQKAKLDNFPAEFEERKSISNGNWGDEPEKVENALPTGDNYEDDESTS